MTKDDDPMAAPRHPLPKRVLAVPGRNTAPAGTPVNKLPADVPASALTPTSDRPPSGAQDTISPPRTVGGHTARLRSGDDDGLDAADREPLKTVRPMRPRRAERARPASMEDDDDETIARIAARVQPPPAGARGGTLRMDAVELPDALAAPLAVPQGPPPPMIPLPPLGPPLDPPETSRDGTASRARRAAEQADPSPAPGAAAPPAMPPVVTRLPGEILISGSEFEQTGAPVTEVESRWPFAFAVGAVSLAIGSLLPLPFRQYIVPAHAETVGSVASLAPAPLPPPATSLREIPHPPSTVSTARTVAPPSTLSAPAVAPPPLVGGVVRPPGFGTVKTSKPIPTTPKDVF